MFDNPLKFLNEITTNTIIGAIPHKKATMKEFNPKRITSLVFCFLAVTTISSARVINPPEATITNGLIEVHLYLPDTENGYYRATRFDWSGVRYRICDFRCLAYVRVA